MLFVLTALLFGAGGASAQDTSPATYTVNPASGTTFTSPTQSVTFTWHDNVRLMDWGFYITLNGVDVTGDFTYTPLPNHTIATSTGTLTLAPGVNTLQVELWDQAENYSVTTVTYTYAGGIAPVEPPAKKGANMPTRQEAVAAIYQQVLERAVQQPEIDYWMGRLASEPLLTIKGIVREIALSPTYRQTHATTSSTITTREVAARLYRHLFAREGNSGELDYWEQYLAGNDYAGMVDVMLADPGYNDYFGEHRVPGRPVAFWDAARAPLVASPIGAAPNLERGLCLTIAAGAGAAYECGDLRIVHGLPAIRTLNKQRAPTLIYNSQQAQPTPLLGANVTIPAGRGTPTRVDAELWVALGTGMTAAPELRIARDWTTNMATDWTPGQTKRIALAFDGHDLGTGPHNYAVVVKATFADGGSPTVETWIQRGTLPVVNRMNSPYGAGWWVAGVEQLFFPGENRLFWVGGDGSTRLYEHRPQPNNPHVYVADTPDRGLDTIRWNPNYDLVWLPNPDGGTYERRLRDGAHVNFDPQTGLHGATVNRLDHHTHFQYDAAGALTHLHVPMASGYYAEKRFFHFEYAGPSATLSRVTAPNLTDPQAQGRPVVVEHAYNDRRVTALIDPDRTAANTVRFGSNVAAFPNRISVRRQPRGLDAYADEGFSYDGGGKLYRAETFMQGTGPNIVLGFYAAESIGIAGALVAAENAYTAFDGPRTDADDRSYFALDRFGAPWRIVDAAVRVTDLTRSDLRFPALVTRVDGPIYGPNPNLRPHHTLSARYNERGNLAAQTDWGRPGSTSGVTRPATTTYEYGYEGAAGEDVRRDLVTRVDLPGGEVTKMDYTANGSLAWTRPGDDVARQVSFDYFEDPLEAGAAVGLVKRVRQPVVGTQNAAERFEYDTRGNLRYSYTPRGYRTEYVNDELGRTYIVKSPISGDTLVQTSTTTFEPNSDRVLTVSTFGPGMNSLPSQYLWVENQYYLDGSVRSVKRWSGGDEAGAGNIITRFRYDLAGRRVAEVAPDGQVDSTRYDAAGNVKEVLTRRVDATGQRLSVTMTYDPTNRLLTRTRSSVTYAGRSEGIGGFGADMLLVDGGNHPYPWYPTPGTTGLVLPSETDTFGYDELGNMVRADSRDALVRRTYNVDGSLESETQKIRTVAELDAGGDTTTHVYTLGYRYDLNGRRIALVHPTGLIPVPSGNNETSYAYNALTGMLEMVTDVMGNQFTFGYNARGERTTLQRPGASTERLGYDEDGRIITHREEKNGLASTRNETLVYDDRGKVLSAINSVGRLDVLTAVYSGLGHVARTTFNQSDSQGHSYTSTESFDQDALANVYHSTYTSNYNRGWGGNVWWGYKDSGGNWSGGSAGYQSGTGRMLYSENTAVRDEYHYDAAGNTEFVTRPTANNRRDRVSYYAADGTIRAADYRTATVGIDNAPYQFTFEEYRYDALGRRVWVRDRRLCKTSTPSDCDVSTVRRTVWDGNQELYEIQMPGEDNSPYLENDTGDLPDLGRNLSGMDRNSFFGRVVYAHGQGIDRPLSITRVKYTDWGPQGGFLRWGAFSMMPQWNVRGKLDGGTFANGAQNLCSGSTQSRCVRVATPNGWFAYDRPSFLLDFWHGTLLEDKVDRAGTAYRRNRQYDPYTGRFTQEDPIGLAGGLNAYGFAGGDPVSYSDPYGLCKVDVRFSALGSIGGRTYYHAYIVNTDRDGSRTYFRGGPSRRGGGASDAAGASGGSSGHHSGSPASGSASSNTTSPGSGGGNDSGESPFGNIETEHAKYEPGTIDWDSGSPPSQRVVDNDDSCERYNKAFSAAADQIGKAGIPYNPFATNSNSVVRTILRQSHIKIGAPIVWAPAWYGNLTP